MKKTKQTSRSGLQVMVGLLGMIKPLLGMMLVAILMGCAGNLMATFITVLGGYGLLSVAGLYDGVALARVVAVMIIFAVARGILRYAEQASNHYIAFKLLARIRHQVFASLRRLAPAKLDGSEKGNLISIITSDIELLEVFYAHTISPIMIAVITSICMVMFIGSMNPWLGLLASIFYVIVGIVIPVINGRGGRENGRIYRDSFGKLNTCVLDNLYGLEDILQYQQEPKRLREMRDKSAELEKKNQELKRGENLQRVVTDSVILSAGIVMAVLSGIFVMQGAMSGQKALLAVIAMMSSFGPTAALSALSNNLHHTLASGNRVLDILAEQPLVEDITGEEEMCQGDILCQNVSFAYEKDTKQEVEILQNFSAAFRENQIHGILGKSGCGKSTLLKLLMRFYETKSGEIRYGSCDVNHINTSSLRNHISYVTQDTFLFHDTIENNIKVAKEEATSEEVVEAARKASIHDFIMTLPNGYETRLAELGNSISGGEKQRIGIARAFLHESPVMFLDEPTSNIDSLNEGIILRSLKKEKENKTILLVSHRKSTMGICDDVVGF